MGYGQMTHALSPRPFIAIYSPVLGLVGIIDAAGLVVHRFFDFHGYGGRVPRGGGARQAQGLS